MSRLPPPRPLPRRHLPPLPPAPPLEAPALLPAPLVLQCRATSRSASCRHLALASSALRLAIQRPLAPRLRAAPLLRRLGSRQLEAGRAYAATASRETATTKARLSHTAAARAARLRRLKPVRRRLQLGRSPLRLKRPTPPKQNFFGGYIPSTDSAFRTSAARQELGWSQSTTCSRSRVRLPRSRQLLQQLRLTSRRATARPGSVGLGRDAVAAQRRRRNRRWRLRWRRPKRRQQQRRQQQRRRRRRQRRRRRS